MNYKIILLSIIYLNTLVFLNAEENGNHKKKSMFKPTVLSSNNFDGNRIDCDMQNNGMLVSHLVSGRSGLSWPKGNGTQTVYASGLWLGGKVDGKVRVSAGEYAGEFGSGPWGANHSDDRHKIYKVNKSDLLEPLNSDDFQNWPVELGAPWIDNNKNGIYEPLPRGPDYPELLGDQVLWMVINDGIDSLHIVFHSIPLGVEIQRTVFGFNRADEIDDVMFIKDLIINKGSNVIKDMYVGLWADSEVGDAADDFIGCDTLLNLGIGYNDGDDVNFHNYVNGTPAVGYDLFQGPIVPSPGEYAYAHGREIANFRNLKMTNFHALFKNDPLYYDPNNAEEAYLALQGIAGSTGEKYPIKFTGGSNFSFPGDPTKDTGPNDNEYIDADVYPSDDRRFLLNSGPFTMSPGDSQEVVYGIINAADGDWDDSYLKLKEVDLMAQRVYDGHFVTGEVPLQPNVDVTSLSDQIILTWDASAEQYESEDLIDLDPQTGETTKYIFEGYNVYQSENAYGSGKLLKIATFDVINDVKIIMDNVFSEEHGVYIFIPTQHGKDSGIQRNFRIHQDYLNDSRLILNREYYFLVTAYGYNEYGSPKTLESSKSAIIVVRPQIPNQWESNEDVMYGSYYRTEHITGSGDGKAYVRVVDPTKVTGNNYKITFNDKLILGDSTLPITNWNLTNLTTNEKLLSNQLIINGVNQLNKNAVGEGANPIVEGLQFIVNGPPLTMKWIGVVQNAGGTLDPPADGLAYWRYPDWLILGDGTPNQSNGSTWFFNTHPGYGTGGYDTFYNSVVVYSGGEGSPNQGIGALIPYDFELRFTDTGGLAFDYWDGGGNITVPFEWWNIGIDTPEDQSDDYRLIPWLLDDNGDSVWGLIQDDHETSGGLNDPYTDRVYVHAPTNNAPGQQGYNDFFTNADPNGSNINAWNGGPGRVTGPTDTWNVMSRTVLMNWNGGEVNDPSFPINVNALKPETGTVFRFVTTKPNTSADEFFFSTDTIIGKTIIYDPAKIKVWPNPYFGYNPEETGYFDRQIHFTHLPENGKCIIRIFDLYGTLVRKIEHTNGTQYEIWDIKNDYDWYIASGMYMAHIETENGDKILKLAVIQPQ